MDYVGGLSVIDVSGSQLQPNKHFRMSSTDGFRRAPTFEEAFGFDDQEGLDRQVSPINLAWAALRVHDPVWPSVSKRRTIASVPS
jgi:hypothetical protein